MQSFSEIDTTSKRASRAAGFAWGIAEEVGKNMRNLEMFGLPGVKNLNLYLQNIKKNPTEKPKKIAKENRPQSKEFCPIYCGTSFLDNCKMLESLKLIKFFMPGNPNISKFLIFFPISSATPHANPAALEARFDVVSISLKDCIINVANYKPMYHLKLSFHEVVERPDTYLF